MLKNQDLLCLKICTFAWKDWTNGTAKNLAVFDDFYRVCGKSMKISSYFDQLVSGMFKSRLLTICHVIEFDYLQGKCFAP